MNIRIVSRAAARWVGAIILTLVAAHLVILVLMHGLGHDYARGFIPLFHLDRERNIPTFFSTALILANAGLIWLVSAIDAPLRWHWRVLAVVMAILSVDELVGFHERLAVTRGASIGEDAVLQYLWPVPYVLGALAVAVFMFPLLRGVGRETARLMVLAGLIYVGGAAGFEAGCPRSPARRPCRTPSRAPPKRPSR